MGSKGKLCHKRWCRQLWSACLTARWTSLPVSQVAEFAVASAGKQAKFNFTWLAPTNNNNNNNTVRLAIGHIQTHTHRREQERRSAHLAGLVSPPYPIFGCVSSSSSGGGNVCMLCSLFVCVCCSKAKRLFSLQSNPIFSTPGSHSTFTFTCTYSSHSSLISFSDQLNFLWLSYLSVCLSSCLCDIPRAATHTHTFRQT